MTEVSETPLPGVGDRIEFISEEGRRVGVVHHRTGRRELFVCSPSDPDTVTMSLDLSDDESHALADALGGSSIVESLGSMTQAIEGLAMDWLKLESKSPFVTKTIGDTRIRTRTGVSVVAAIRGGEAVPAPGPEFRLEADDTLIVVGTPEGIDESRRILTMG